MSNHPLSIEAIFPTWAYSCLNLFILSNHPLSIEAIFPTYYQSSGGYQYYM